MATDKQISIVLRAKNMMAAGLSSAGSALKSFGASAVNIGKWFAKGFLAAGAAVAGFAAKALSAYGEAEKAQRDLASAMNAQGEAGDALLPMFKRIAGAIQDETGASDEATLASMARFRALGVGVAQLEAAAKAEIALKAVGLEGASAQRAVALAMQGNYDMLNRYIPAIRNATTEQEKAAAFQDVVSRGYIQQAATLDTVSGQWGLLKGRIGDVWEEIGAAIAQNDALMGMLKRAGEAVKAFGERVAAWVEGGGVVRLIAGVKLFYANAKQQFQLAGNAAHVMFAAIGDGVDTVFTYAANVVRGFGKVYTTQFQYVADMAAAIFAKIKNPLSEFKPPDMGAYKDALVDLGKALAGQDALVTRRTVAALDERQKIHDDYAAEIERISQEQAAAQIAHEEKVAKAKEDAAEAERNLAQQTTIIVRKAVDDRASASIDALKAELEAIQDNRRAIEDLAKSRVQAEIERRREAQQEAGEIADEIKRAGRLESKQRRGVRLGKGDREWLSAFKAIEQAQKESSRLAAAEQTVQGQLDAAEKALEQQKKAAESLGKIESKIDEVLSYPG